MDEKKRNESGTNPVLGCGVALILVGILIAFGGYVATVSDGASQSGWGGRGGGGPGAIIFVLIGFYVGIPLAGIGALCVLITLMRDLSPDNPAEKDDDDG